MFQLTVEKDGKSLSFYCPLTKRDDAKRMVYGYASTAAVDTTGEVITLGALTDALPDYMKFANVREMHQLSAVGVTKEADIDERGLYIGAKVVDEAAWQKVIEGVYKGFSVGGTATKRDPQDRRQITGLDLIEISLVDRPCNGECIIEVYKASQPKGKPMTVEAKARELAKAAGKDPDAVLVKSTNAPDVLTWHTFQDEAGAALQREAVEKAARDDAESRAQAEAEAAAATAALVGVPIAAVAVPNGQDTSEEAVLRARLITGATEAAAGLSLDGLRTAVDALDRRAADELAKGKRKPKAGDKITFEKDDKTEKGPSSGTIASVDGGNVGIDHSDKTADPFEWDKLKAEWKDDCWVVKLGNLWAPGEGRPSEGSKAAAADAPEIVVIGKAGDYGTDEEAGYADPGYQADQKTRLPLKKAGTYDAGRIRGAWAYFVKNVTLYDDINKALVVEKAIVGAWCEAIDKNGPPSAESKVKAPTTNEDKTMKHAALQALGKADAATSLRKGLFTACSALGLLGQLNYLHEDLAREAAVEGDNSPMPGRFRALLEMMAGLVQAVVEEEVEEMLNNTEATDSMGPMLMYAAKPLGLAKARIGRTAFAEALTKAIGDKTGSPKFELLSALADEIAKGTVPQTQGWGETAGSLSTSPNNSWSEDNHPNLSNDVWGAHGEHSQKVHDLAVGKGAKCEAAAKAAPAAAVTGKDIEVPKTEAEMVALAVKFDEIYDSDKHKTIGDLAKALDVTEDVAKDVLIDAIAKAKKAKPAAGKDGKDGKDGERGNPDGADDEDDDAKKAREALDRLGLGGFVDALIDISKGQAALNEKVDAIVAGAGGRRNPTGKGHSGAGAVVEKGDDTTALGAAGKTTIDPKDPAYPASVLKGALANPRVITR